MRPATLVAAALVGAALLALPALDDPALRAGATLGLGAAALAAVLAEVSARRAPGRTLWRALAAAYALLLLREAWPLAAGMGKAAPALPSAGPDVLTAAGFTLAALALAGLVKARTALRDRGALADAAILASGAAVLLWMLASVPGVPLTGAEAMERLGALAVLALVARLLVAPGGRSPATVLLGASGVAIAVQHVAASLPDGFAEALAGLPVLPAGLLAAAALQPSMGTVAMPAGERSPPLDRRRIALLLAASLATPTAFVLQTSRGVDVGLPVVVAGCTALFLLVGFRLSGLVSRHEQAVARESVFRRAAASLVEAADRDGVVEAAARSAQALAAESGAEVRLARVLEAEALPQPLARRLGSGGLVRATPAESAALGAPGAYVAVAPLSVGGRTAGALVVAVTRPPSEHLWDGLEFLGAQVTLALEGAWLAEERHRERSEARFRSLVQNSSDVVAIVESDTLIRFHTPSAETILGFAEGALVGRRLTELVEPADLHSVKRRLAEARAPGSTVVCEFGARRANGSVCRLEAVVSNRLHDPNVRGIIVTLRDVTERRALEQRLEHQAFHDPLTGLANRTLFAQRLDEALNGRGGHWVALLFLDLDDFKTVNDALGHVVGDELLETVARRIASTVREGDVCARLGGDEFAILLDGVEHPDDVQGLAGRLLSEVRRPLRLGDRDVTVRASVGIAVVRRGTARAVDLLRDADSAMYRAKSLGKDRVQLYDPRMHAEALQRLELKTLLGEAIAGDRLRLAYQPIVALRGGGVAGFEALVRWPHTDGRVLQPDDFIPLAEESGLIVPLGKWVLGEAMEELGAWLRDGRSGGGGGFVTVNVSTYQLRDERLVDDIADVLDAHRLPPASLVLEMTESTVMHDPDAASAQLERLKELGVRLALDDFGTGYSSLSHLRRFPLDILKIAKPFVDEIATTSRDARLARSIVGLGDTLELQTVAEGVESEDQRRVLEELRCHFGQGFHFARPLSADEALSLIQRNLRRLRAA